MKKLSVLFALALIISLAYPTEAQYRIPKLIIITLNQDSASLATPSVANLVPGDTLQFIAVNGDFDILIRDAYQFLRIKDDDLKLRLDSSGDAFSDKYIVRNIKEYKTDYNPYCISNNSWPLAPPRIIIKVN